jgi:flagellar hook-associated protein 3 FlgL
MTERITFQMQSGPMLASLNSDLNQLDNTQMQMSSGRQINQPSDNPYGTTLAMQLNGDLTALGSYNDAVNDGTAWANTTAGALNSVQQMVQSARTLIVEGLNGVNNQTSLDSIAAQVTQIVSQVKQTANSEYNGQYIFSGTATGTAPYLTGAGASDTYQGNTGAINRAIGPGTTVQVNAGLGAVLGNGQASNDGLLLNTLENAASDLAAGNQSALGTDLSQLDTNNDALIDLQSNVGATQTRLQLASTRITSFQLADQTQLGNTVNVDMASASINLSTEQAAYSAALQSGAQILQTSLLNFLHT